MANNKYIWLLKGDNAYKNYVSKRWNTIISVKVENDDIYYCLSNGKQFINEEEKIKLIAPICIINSEYKDCVVVLTNEEDLNFIWKNKRCFSITDSFTNDFIDSTINFFQGRIIRVASAAQLASENSILVKSSSIVPVIVLAICFVILSVFGLFVWLL